MLRNEPSLLTRIAAKLDEVKSNSSINKLIDRSDTCSASTLAPLAGDEIHIQSGNMIAQARSEVCIQFYKFFGTSDGGREIIAGLRALQARVTHARPAKPIIVNVLLNARGKLAQTLYKANNTTGLETLIENLNNEFFQLRLGYHPTAAFGTFHTKMIVVDGEFGMLRGGDPAEPNNYDKFQFETATLSTGSNVRCMRADFQHSWNLVSGKDQPRMDDLPEVKQLERKTDIPCLFISKKENGSPASIKYRGCLSPYKIALLEAVSGAIESIKIMSPNFNDLALCHALAEACNRGVRVQIVMGKHHNDTAEKYWGGTNFETMSTLVSFVDPEHRKNLNIKWATNLAGEIVKHGEKYSVHGKFACIDNCLVFVGSTPLDKQGIDHSREADLLFEDSIQAKIFINRMFKNKFTFGKDYFVDCFETLVAEVESRIKKLASSVKHPQACRKKANLLRNGLREVLSVTDHPDVENHNKPTMLLKALLPILNIPTSHEASSRKTSSYKAFRAIAKQYGIYKSKKSPASTDMLERKVGEEKAERHSATLMIQAGLGLTPIPLAVATPTPLTVATPTPLTIATPTPLTITTPTPLTIATPRH